MQAGGARCSRMDEFGSAIVMVLQQSRNSQVSPVGAGGDGRESWEWIGPTCDGGESMAGWVLLCLLGAATGKREICCFLFATCVLDKRAKIWIVGQSVGQNSPSTRQAGQDKTENGGSLGRRYYYCHSAGYLTYRHISNRDTGTSRCDTSSFLTCPVLGGGKARPVLYCVSLSAYQAHQLATFIYLTETAHPAFPPPIPTPALTPTPCHGRPWPTANP